MQDISTTLVVNWHINEACNYGCKYCYAAWKAPQSQREVVRNSEQSVALMTELNNFFQPGNNNNPLSRRLTWNAVRLNIAGGEPLLHARKLPKIIDHARELGFETSMITNGHYLDDELLHRSAAQMSWLGISIDSADPTRNRAIGRIDKRSRLLNIEQLTANIAIARKSNPSLSIKINTVVNKLNYSDDMSELLYSFAPEKWKVLRMLLV